MSNRKSFQNFQNLIFLHIFEAFLWEAQFLKGIRLKSVQYERKAIFTESLVHNTLFNTVVYGSNETNIIMYNLKTWNFMESTEILEISFFLYISSDLCHKKVLLQSLNIPLKVKYLYIGLQSRCIMGYDQMIYCHIHFQISASQWSI